MVPVQTAYDLGKLWYRGRTDVGWVPPTPQEGEETFAAVGLVGEFWRLLKRDA